LQNGRSVSRLESAFPPGTPKLAVFMLLLDASINKLNDGEIKKFLKLINDLRWNDLISSSERKFPGKEAYGHFLIYDIQNLAKNVDDPMWAPRDLMRVITQKILKAPSLDIIRLRHSLFPKEPTALSAALQETSLVMGHLRVALKTSFLANGSPHEFLEPLSEGLKRTSTSRLIEEIDSLNVADPIMVPAEAKDATNLDELIWKSLTGHERHFMEDQMRIFFKVLLMRSHARLGSGGGEKNTTFDTRFHELMTRRILEVGSIGLERGDESSQKLSSDKLDAVFMATKPIVLKRVYLVDGAPIGALTFSVGADSHGFAKYNLNFTIEQGIADEQLLGFLQKVRSKMGELTLGGFTQVRNDSSESRDLNRVFSVTSGRRHPLRDSEAKSLFGHVDRVLGELNVGLNVVDELKEL
jgi:hypothetical protein